MNCLQCELDTVLAGRQCCTRPTLTVGVLVAIIRPAVVRQGLADARVARALLVLGALSQTGEHNTSRTRLDAGGAGCKVLLYITT